MGQEGQGFLASPITIAGDIKRQYHVGEMGRLNGLIEKYFVVSMDRQV